MAMRKKRVHQKPPDVVGSTDWLKGRTTEQAILDVLYAADMPLFPCSIEDAFLCGGFETRNSNLKSSINHYCRLLKNDGFIEQAPLGRPHFLFPQGWRLTKKGKYRARKD